MQFDRIADIKRLRFFTEHIQVNVPPGGQILDVGCGNGIITRAVGALGFHITGIDVSDKSIAIARSLNNLPNVEFEVHSASNLASRTKFYDAIICSEVLEHLHEPAELLSTIHDSLKDTGILLVTVPNGRGPRELLVTKPVQTIMKYGGARLLLTRVKRSMGYEGFTVQSSADDLTHIQFFTVRSLRDLALAAGFTITKLAAANFIEQVFPFSLVARKSTRLQHLDCMLADRLPVQLSSGFMMLWKKV